MGLVFAAIAFRCRQLTSNTQTPAAVTAPKSAAVSAPKSEEVSAPKSAAVSAREPIDHTKRLNLTKQEQDDVVARTLTALYAKRGITFPVKARVYVN
jgi:hypothetical protein